MGPTNIRPGTKLTLGFYSRKGEDMSLELNSTFEADEKDGMFIIAAPFHGSNYYPVPIGDTIFISYSDSNARYDMQGKVVHRFRVDQLAYLRLARISEIVRTQRRDDYRLEVVMDIELERMVERDEKFYTHIIKARTIDLSGGGSAMWCDEYIPEGEKLLCSVPINEKGSPVYINSEVRWVRRGDRDAAYKYFIGLRFLHKRAQDKEKIVKYIFALQRKRMSLSSKRTESNPFEDLI